MDEEKAVVTEEETPAQGAGEAGIAEEAPAEDREGEGTASEKPPQEEESEPDPSEYGQKVRKRIGQVTKKLRTTEREIEALKAENERLKAKAEAGPRPEPPDPNRFMDDLGVMDSERYRRATMDYEDKAHEWRKANESPASSQEESVPPEGDDLREAFEAFNERADAMRAKHDDFDQVVDREVFTPSMMESIFDSEAGPEIAYYLVNNDSEALRIGSLDIRAMEREIGKLEARFSAPPNKRAVSGAPAPIKPLEGNDRVEKDPEKMSTEEWMAYREKEELKSRGLSP